MSDRQRAASVPRCRALLRPIRLPVRRAASGEDAAHATTFDHPPPGPCQTSGPSPRPRWLPTAPSRTARRTTTASPTPPTTGLLRSRRPSTEQVQAQRLAAALSNNNTATPGNPTACTTGTPPRVSTPRTSTAQGARSSCSTARRSGAADFRQRAGGPDQHAGRQAGPRRRTACASSSSASTSIQYEAIGFSNWSTWGSDPVEGTARVMQDKLYSDLDDDAGCIAYLAQVNNYLAIPAARCGACRTRLPCSGTT